MEISEIKRVESSAIAWLTVCYQKAHQKGFAHSRHQYLPSLIAWKNLYPETTAYLIENILMYNAEEWPQHETVAKNCLDYLVSIQHPDGYFYKGTGKKQSSFFNTAQVLFGLKIGYEYFNNEEYQHSYWRAEDWCLKNIAEDGMIKDGLYVQHYMASYYSRALWPLCKNERNLKPNLINAISRLSDLYNGKYNFSSAGFFPNKEIVNHSYFYTLEGFYEISKLLKLESLSLIVENCIQYICELYITNKKIPGRFWPDGGEDFSERCITGEAQLVSLLAKMCLDQFDEKKYNLAIDVFKQISAIQVRSDNAEFYGAFPSSIPIGGHYFPYRYVNWTNKFVLDACFYLQKLLSSSNQ